MIGAVIAVAIYILAQNSTVLAKTLGRPNGLAFSCRERDGRCLSKTNDLAREAVCCNAGLGGGFVIRPFSQALIRTATFAKTPTKVFAFDRSSFVLWLLY
jgi:hypothetical protein